ncbi:MAG TPA: VWA domain-containing protein [Thermoanaerobaculia bacterium]|nr:VWA domain-containing protein [Thermoanaerobaculia bacterium]
MLTRFVLALLLVCLPGAGISGIGAAAAQTAPPPSPEDATFGDTLDVQAVHVDVVVTDEVRNRVQGLTAADFRLLVEGREVEVETFAEVRDGKVVTPDADEVGNRYLIFLDEIFTQSRLRDEALQGIARDVKNLDPRDQVAIVAMDGQQLDILCAWTHPGPALDQLLTRMLRHNGYIAGAGIRLETADPAAERVREAYQSHLDRLYAEEAWRRGAVEDARRELAAHEKSLGAAAAALRAFTGVPGRKLMLVLSGGWTANTSSKRKKGNQLLWEIGGPGAARGPQGVSASLLAPLVDTANLMGFTVYPVFLTFQPQAGNTGELQVVEGEKQGALRYSAVETGGDVLRPGRNRHLEKVALDTRFYYRLGFSFTGDNRRRDVQVEARKPGLRTRALTSFLPLSRAMRTSLQVNTALLDGALNGMAPLEVAAGQMRRIANDQAEVRLTVRIPVDQLTLLPETGRKVGQLELRIAAAADDGDRAVVPSVPIRIVHKEPEPLPPVQRYDTTIQIRHKAQQVQVVLVDLLSGKTFAGRVRVEPKKM